MTIAWILGQNGERQIGSTGWVGEHPVTGQDVPHLLLYPLGNGVADKMRDLAQLLTLPSADRQQPVHDVPATTARLVTDDNLDLHLYLGERLLFTRPISHEWSDAALLVDQAVITLGVDGFTGRMQELDRYLRRRARIYIGRIEIRYDDGILD